MKLLLATIVPLLLRACIKKRGDNNDSTRNKPFLFITKMLLFIFTNARGKTNASAQELSDKLSNPVARLISVPFQNNVDCGIGTYHGSKYTLNFQPVIPISLSPKLNLITRYVIPIVDQHDITGEGEDEFGLSDATISGFFSRAAQVKID